MLHINRRIVVKTNMKHHIQKGKEEKNKIKKIIFLCMGVCVCVWVYGCVGEMQVRFDK